MKKWYQAEWAHKYDEIAKCTILAVECNVLKEVKVHKQYLQAMQNMTSSSTYHAMHKLMVYTTLYSCMYTRHCIYCQR